MAIGGKPITWKTIETLVSLPINDTNTLVVDVNESDTGRIVIGVREWYTTDGENWFPGKKGLSLRPEQWAEVAPAIAAWVTANPAKPDEDGKVAVGGGSGRKLLKPKRPVARKV